MWRKLSPRQRDLLRARLRGLYGHDAADRKVFDGLGLDKRRALLLLARRFDALDLWRHVRRVTNVWGTGGTGFEFIADAQLGNVLAARDDFTTRFARHRSASVGYLERRRTRATLHILCADAEAQAWSAHFDLHSPVASPASALRHLWHERLRGRRPAWREIEILDRDLPPPGVCAASRK